MLKRKHFFTYKNIPIASFFIVEGFQCLRFKTKDELKSDLRYFYRKLIAKLKKETITKADYSWYSTKSLSSFDYHIQEKGGIVDCNGNVHTTARSYKNFLKDNDLVIKDWSDGSNKQKQQLSDRAEVAKIVNKYI
jgi:hypothetical protein